MMKYCIFFVFFTTAFLYAESEDVNKETQSVYDLIQYATKSILNLEKTNHELRDRFKLLSYVLNTTISYHIYEIAVELRDSQFDADDLKYVHDNIFNAKDELNLNITKMVQFSIKMGVMIHKVHIDLKKNLLDLVEDFSELVSILLQLDEVYWSTFPSVYESMEKIRSIITEVIQKENGSVVDDIAKSMIKIDALIEGEKIGIEICKYDMDSKITNAQYSIKNIIDRLKPDAY